MWFYLAYYACTLYRSASDSSVVIGSPIAPRRSERLLALRKSKEASTISLSESKPAIKESTGGKETNHQFGESSKTTVKDNKADKITNSTTYDKQTSSKRSTKKSQSESDLVPKQRKRRRAGSPEEDKPNLPKDKIQRTSSRTTGVTSANLIQSGSKRAKSSAIEPLLTSPKGKSSGGQDKGKKTTGSSREGKTRKGKSSAGTSTSGVTTRQLRKLKGRNLKAEMSSDE